MRIIIAGSGRLGVSVMEQLLESGHEVVGLLQNRRNKSRGRHWRQWLRALYGLNYWSHRYMFHTASLPLPEYIAHLYEKRFGKTCPDVVRPIEEMAAAQMAKRADRKSAKEAKRLEEARQQGSEPEDEPAPTVDAGDSF